MSARERSATTAERHAIDTVLGRDGGAAPAGADGAGRVARRAGTAGRRSLLLPALGELQHRTGGVSPGAVAELARRLDLGQAEVYGVASFYALLDVEDAQPVEVHLCDDVACRLRGAEQVAEAWERAFGAGGAPGGAALCKSPCLGQCDRAPAALVIQAGEAPREVVVAPATVEAVADVLAGGPAPPRPAAASAGGPVALCRVGRTDPESIDSYRAAGGYTALREALRIGRDGVIRQVTDAGLQGRGGAAFPTGVKWRAVASQPDLPRFVVANGDESEPGTFKDRVLMEEDPFALVEALTIAGFAIGAERGYVYVRGEYPLAAARVGRAVEQARARGLLGEDILGRGLRFDVEVRRGAGAYICGEETALLNSIEGFAGEPRNKPPFPATRGLFGKPTAVNNIETLFSVLAIVSGGPAAFRALGSPEAPGTRLVSVSGSVTRPGVYELSSGAALGEVVALAGALPPGRALQAVLLGGAAGTFVGPEALNMALTPSSLRASGATLGSGAVVVFDDGVDLQDIVLRIARFFRDESCGQCVPCRIGAVRQEELVARLVAGRPLTSVAAEVGRLRDLAQAMRDASICGLGQTAPAAVESALRLGIFGKEAQQA